MLKFILNNKSIQTELAPGMVMLDFIRIEQHLKGTKIGCREGDCGACTVLVGELKNGQVFYQSMTSCLMPIGNAHGKHIVTVEGINMDKLNPVQQAIVEEGGTQCGFCTVGFVMSLVGFCLSEKNPDYENALAAIDGNICRCTGYKSLERAAHQIVEQVKVKNKKESIAWLVNNHFLPSYFLEIESRLKQINPLKTENKNSIRVGGGTDLYVQKKESVEHASIDLMLDKPTLKGIVQSGNKITIGASTTVEDLRSSELMLGIFSRLKKQLKLVSSTPIRNMATLAGNFVNASPIGDMSIFFLALNASLLVSNGSKKRTVLLKDFYKGYKLLDKTPEEEITQISFELPSSFYFNFEKVSKRTHLDIASVNSALSIEMNEEKIVKANLAIGGVFAYPLYLQKTSEFLSHKLLSPATLLEAAQHLQTEIKPISDARGTAEYKRLLARQLFFAHFIELFPDQLKIEDLLLNELV
jgi:xanthine dehydrogenase small subunit